MYIYGHILYINIYIYIYSYMKLLYSIMKNLLPDIQNVIVRFDPNTHSALNISPISS